MTTEHDDTKPQRYDLEWVGSEYMQTREMVADDEGGWVDYDDHAKTIADLETKLAAAERQAAEAQAELVRVRDDVLRSVKGMCEHANDTVWASEFETMADALAGAVGCDTIADDGCPVEALAPPRCGTEALARAIAEAEDKND